MVFKQMVQPGALKRPDGWNAAEDARFLEDFEQGRLPRSLDAGTMLKVRQIRRAGWQAAPMPRRPAGG
jgi:hypothetical protein